MLILGTGKEEIDMGPIHPQDCEICQREQPFRLRLVYRYEHVFLVLGHTRALSYVIVCEVCSTPFRIPRKVGRKLARIDREPIPFLRRYGCLIFYFGLLLIAGLAVASRR
jgi:hypothetical protein